MKFSEYKKIIYSTPETENLVMSRVFAALNPAWILVGVVSLGSDVGRIVRVPKKAKNDYGNTVPVVAIAGQAFRGNENITDIILPSEIFRIGKGSFAGCTGLKRITIPRKVKEIKEGTFEGCNSLEDVFYEGTKEEWNKIKIVHQKHEIEFGPLIHGTPVHTIKNESFTHIPGNDALLQANIHFGCEF